MDVADKNQPGNVKAEKPGKPETPRKPVQDDPLDDPDPSIKDQLFRAKATRVNAESARQKICSEIIDASKRLYQSMIEEGEQAMDRAKKLEAAAELKIMESQRELQRSQSIRGEADSHLKKVIAQAEAQSQETIRQSQSIKADAVAFREKLLFEIKQQAELELDQAQSRRVEADTYRERVIAQAQRQANDTLDRARLTAEKVGSEIKQRYAMEARKALAQADLIKSAAEEHLEAQRLYTDAANLQSESQEVLDRARSMINQESPLHGLNSGYRLSGNQTSAPEQLPATGDQPEGYRAKPINTFLAGETRRSSRYELPPEPESSNSWMKDVVDPASAETAVTDGPGPTEAKGPTQQTPELPSTNPDISDLLPTNELVLGVESNHQCRAYPFSTISQQRIINDTVGELDILVTFGPPSELAMIFNRNLEGRSLMFETVAELQNGNATMKDQETGSIWEALTGRAIGGPLAGRELERLTSEYSFWLSWIKVHPTSEVYTGV